MIHKAGWRNWENRLYWKVQLSINRHSYRCNIHSSSNQALTLHKFPTILSALFVFASVHSSLMDGVSLSPCHYNNLTAAASGTLWKLVWPVCFRPSWVLPTQPNYCTTSKNQVPWPKGSFFTQITKHFFRLVVSNHANKTGFIGQVFKDLWHLEEVNGISVMALVHISTISMYLIFWGHSGMLKKYGISGRNFILAELISSFFFYFLWFVFFNLVPIFIFIL